MDFNCHIISKIQLGMHQCNAFFYSIFSKKSRIILWWPQSSVNSIGVFMAFLDMRTSICIISMHHWQWSGYLGLNYCQFLILEAILTCPGWSYLGLPHIDPLKEFPLCFPNKIEPTFIQLSCDGGRNEWISGIPGFCYSSKGVMFPLDHDCKI